MKDRGDLLGDDLLPRKTKAQGSVPAPAIALGEPQPAPPTLVTPPPADAPAREKEKGVAMTFRLSPADWIRLKSLSIRTRKSGQQLLYESLDRTLKENGL